MTASDLARRVEVARALAERSSARGLIPYLNHVVIDSRPEQLPYRDVAEAWQWEIERLVAPMLEKAAGLRPDYHGPQNIWITMPRGHDKTSGFARRINWLLGWAPRRIVVVAAASDSEQVEQLTDAMLTESRLNAWIGKRLPEKNFSKRRVDGIKGNVLKIQPADAASSWGHRADVILCDEITHWKGKEPEEVWRGLWSGREKRSDAAVVVISNAGVLDTWQHEILKAAKRDPVNWIVRETPPYTRLASWMDAAKIDAMRKLLPPAEAKRVLDNVWIDAAEESGYVTRQDVEACERLGVQLGLFSRLSGAAGGLYVAAVDYGPKKDRTALAVVHWDHQQNLLIVDRLDVWQGTPNQPVQIARVEDWIKQVNRDFNQPLIVVDPYQMEGTVQQFEPTMRIERFESRGGKKNYEMAENLRSLIVNQRIAWPAGVGALPTNDGLETLLDELCSLVVKQMNYGYRFDHLSGRHDDRTVAVGMAALAAVRDQAVEWVAPEKVQAPSTVFLPEYVLPTVSSGGRSLFGMD